MCWSNFVSNLDQFSKYIRDRLLVPVFQVDGRIPVGDEAEYDDPSCHNGLALELKTRERVISRFLGTVVSAILVTNPASCSESISLHHGCHNAIYLDPTYDGALFLQSVDRIHRLGLSPDTTVSIHIILSTIDEQPTIDHLVEASLQQKEDRMRRLLVLQRQFREGCGVMPAWQRGAWHGSVWPVRYCPAYPQATAATRLARTVPGAAFPAPPGRPAAS